MKKLTLFLFLSCCSYLSFSQDVIFCEKVNTDGTPVKPSAYFKISKKGGFFNVLVKHKNSIASTEVTFDIYLMSEDADSLKKEIFVNSVKMKVNPESTWFYKEITF